MMNENRITHKQFLEAKETVIKYRQQILGEIKECNDVLYNHDTSINQLDLSARAYNVLVGAGCKTLMDILAIPISKMRTLRNWGRKSEKELIEFKERYVLTNEPEE